jgi:hypothetical protein
VNYFINHQKDRKPLTIEELEEGFPLSKLYIGEEIFGIAGSTHSCHQFLLTE